MKHNIPNILKAGRNILKKSEIESFNLDALILLQHCLSLSKEQIIFADSSQIVNEETVERFFELIYLRQKAIPVAKIIGKKEFYEDVFYVNHNVLDPRPDSESLIECVKKNYPNFSDKIFALELGVGSGCLILSLLKIYVNMKAIGVDISSDALLVAIKNSKNLRLNSRIKLFQSDLFSKISNDNKFDLIISNPPYIKSQDIKKLSKDVSYDPLIALDGGFDGLDFYKRIAQKAQLFLKDQAMIIVEVGHNQSDLVKEIFANEDFCCKSSYYDLNGIERILSFIKKK